MRYLNLLKKKIEFVFVKLTITSYKCKHLKLGFLENVLVLGWLRSVCGVAGGGSLGEGEGGLGFPFMGEGEL